MSRGVTEHESILAYGALWPGQTNPGELFAPAPAEIFLLTRTLHNQRLSSK